MIANADLLVERFIKALKNDPDLGAIAYLAGPQLAMISDRTVVVEMLDRAAELWAKARGGRFDVEVPA